MRKLFAVCVATACLGALYAFGEPVDVVNSPKPQQFQSGAYFGNTNPNGQVNNTTPLYVQGDAGVAGSLNVGALTTDGGLILGPTVSPITFMGSSNQSITGKPVMPGMCNQLGMAMAMAGADAGDSCFIGLPTLPSNDIGYNCYVGTGTCQLNACNGSQIVLTSLTGLFKCTVIH